jgi:hypothetical protein
MGAKISKRVNPYDGGPDILYEREREKGSVLMPKSKAPKTYFEQVPLAIVKQLAVEETLDSKTNRVGAIAKPPAKSTLPPRVPPVSNRKRRNGNSPHSGEK